MTHPDSTGESHRSALTPAIVSFRVIQPIAFVIAAMGVVVDVQGAFQASKPYIYTNIDLVHELRHLVCGLRNAPKVRLPPACIPPIPFRPPPLVPPVRSAVPCVIGSYRRTVVALEVLNSKANLDVCQVEEGPTGANAQVQRDAATTIARIKVVRTIQKDGRF